MRPRHFACLLAVVFGGITLAGAAVNLSYVDFGPGGNACCLVPDGLGNLYVIGSVAGASGTNISVTRLDAAHHVAGSFTFGGGGSDQPKAAALDPQGNLVIAGQTNSSDFPLVNVLISQTEPRVPAGFITKVNPSSGQILFSTRIGGLAAESFVRIGSAVNALAVDPGGNIYAAGWTNVTDFPVSADAFQKSGAGGSSFGTRPFGFVLKLSPAGDRLLYSTLLGGATADCFGGSHCVGKFGSNTVNAIAVDRNGIATVGGTTNSPDFPVTTGVVQTVCRCQEYANNGFVAQLNADGSGLRWSTFLGGSWYRYSQVPAGINTIDAVGQDAAGNVVVAGRTDADDFPTTPGVLQAKLAGTVAPYQRSTDGFVSKLNPTGTALLFSTYLGGSLEDRVNDLQMDAQGNIWVTGATTSTDLPGTPASFTGSFFALVSADGARLLASQRTPTGAAGQAIRASGAVTVLGASGSVLQVPGGQVQGRGGLRRRQCCRQRREGLCRAGRICQPVWQPARAEPGCERHPRQPGPHCQPACWRAGALQWNSLAIAVREPEPGERSCPLWNHWRRHRYRPSDHSGRLFSRRQPESATGPAGGVQQWRRCAGSESGQLRELTAEPRCSRFEHNHLRQRRGGPAQLATGRIDSQRGRGWAGLACGRAPQQPLARSVVRRECSRPGNQPPANQPAFTTAGGRRRVSTYYWRFLFRPLLARCPVGRKDKRLSSALGSLASRSQEGRGDSAVGA